MREAYLDNSSTTQVDAAVAAAVSDVMLNHYGNPSSLHRKGFEAQQLFEQAAVQVAAPAGARRAVTLFTSGGTEANNLAIFGAVHAYRRRGNKVVTTAFEHASVIEAFAQLEHEGLKAVYIKPDSTGSIDAEEFLSEIDSDTVLASAMLVNNEVGSILPVWQLAARAKAINPGVIFHCDAVQGYGKLSIDFDSGSIDLLTVSGHKIHAPKGVGALFCKKGVRLTPLVYGGGQQGGVRPGTENLPLACGMGVAAERIGGHMAANTQHVTALRRQALAGLAAIDGVNINSPEGGLPHILNISVPGYRSEVMLHHLAEDGVYVSSASACGKGAKSHVLQAMGLPPAAVDSSLRISFSAHNTPEDVEQLLTSLAACIRDRARVRR